MATSSKPSHPSLGRRHSLFSTGKRRPHTAVMAYQSSGQETPGQQVDWNALSSEWQNSHTSVNPQLDLSGARHRFDENEFTVSPNHRHSKSFSGLFHSLSEFRSLARRMSHSVRSKRGKLPTMDEDHIIDDSEFPAFELSSSTTQGKDHTFRHRSTRPRNDKNSRNSIRRPLDLPPNSTFPHQFNPAFQLSRPSTGMESPSFSGILSGGAAARAAAAAQNAQNEMLGLGQFENLRIERVSWEDGVLRDSESGIGIDLRDKSSASKEDLPVDRKDPAQYLPAELMTQVLSELDSKSVLQCELVSRNWMTAARTQYVWRKVFGRECAPRGSVAPANRRIPRIGGIGMGAAAPGQDWRRMLQARKALDNRWRYREAAAIYLHGHSDSVYCVQFDEEKIITGSRDQTIRVWDIHTYQCLKIIGRPRQTKNGSQTRSLPQLSRGSNSNPIASFTNQNVSQATAIQNEHSDEYHDASILCLQFDKEIMVTGSSDHTCIIWDIEQDYKPIHRLVGHAAGVLDVCFNEKIIISCSKDTTLRVWDRFTGELITKLLGHRGPVNAVQMRGELAVSASGDGIAKLWNLTTGVCIKEFPSKDRGLACVEFSEDGKTIFAGGNDQVIYMFDASSGALIRELKGHKALVRSLHLDVANRRVISGSYDMSVKVFDLDTGELIIDFPDWTTSWMLSAKGDYRRIIATSQDSRAVIMDFGYGLKDVELLEGR